MNREKHWDRIYGSKDPTEVSWYQPEALLSLQLIRRVAPDGHSPVIDVGGGASTLVDGLLGAGYRNITILDLAPAALARAQERMGRSARAVFHFLTDRRDRARYVAETRRVVRPGGYLIVASFGPEGPSRCSGLDVVRYSPEGLHSEFGPTFELLESLREDHRSPSGSLQPFVYCLCRV